MACAGRLIKSHFPATFHKDSMNVPGTNSGLNDGCAPSDGDVHIRRVDLEAICAEESRWEKLLSADERQRASRFKFPRDRQHFIAARAMLRTFLGQYLCVDPDGLNFSYSLKGKPHLSQDYAGGLSFNLSHSGGIALYAFSRNRDLGIDIEQIRQDFEVDGIARRFFSPLEQDQLFALPVDERAQAFFRCWSRKEAYIKATGDGLSLPLSQFDVSLDRGNTDALVTTRPDGAEAARWRLTDIHAGTSYAAALCVRGRDWTLNYL
jgi:4'-phosphopantetheinyl transferase